MKRWNPFDPSHLFFDRCEGNHNYEYSNCGIDHDENGEFILLVYMKCTECGKKTTLEE